MRLLLAACSVILFIDAAGYWEVTHMPKKFYAVRMGREGPKIYPDWDSCRAQVQGFSGAVYKSFPTLAEAEAFIKGGEVGTGERSGAAAATAPGKNGAVAAPGKNRAVAYVDGSFDSKSGDFACGAVLFLGGEELTFSERFHDPEMAAMHNVAGEIMGALTVIRYCLERGVPALEIHHDYEGVGRWADGSWKANKPGTQRYAAECLAAAQRMRLSFVKVRGHSGDTYNDMADGLARSALGL